MLITFERTLLSLSGKGDLEDTSAQKILRQIIDEGFARGEFTANRTAESIYGFFQIFFHGIRIRFCHNAGASLPDRRTEEEILRWIDSLFE